MPFVLVIGALIGLALYKEAEKFERQYGKGPWGGSPILWGIVGFLFGLFGALFLWIAERNTKKQVQNNVVWSQPGYGDPRYAVPPAQQWAPPPGPWAPPATPAPAPAAAPVAPPAQWGAPPPPPGPPPGPTAPPGPPAPNVGGSDFLPRR